MKAYKVTLLVIDFDELGQDGIEEEIENVRYPNDCLYPTVMAIESRDIGEWSDDHPLNHHATQESEFERLFGVEP